MGRILRALVVDDSTLFRKVVRDALAMLPNVEVVGVASDGEQALRQIESLKPDLVTLDLEMPLLDGLGVLTRLDQRVDSPAVVMISAQTTAGAETTTKALQLGAIDFVVKPVQDSLAANQEELKQSLAPIVTSVRANLSSATASVPSTPSPLQTRKSGSLRSTLPPKAIIIGVSTGGPAALGQLLPEFPADFPKPIIIVQHMPPVFTRSLAEQLDRSCKLHVVEGEHGQVCRAGEIYIAPGELQMGIEEFGGRVTLYTTNDPPEKNCKPAVDYLFRSAAKALGDRCVAAVLTGMGDDGLEGCKVLKRAGVKIIAQDESSSVVYGMPRQIADHSLADAVLPLGKIADAMLEAVHHEVSKCL